MSGDLTVELVEDIERQILTAAEAAPCVPQKVDLDMALMYVRHALKGLKEARNG